MKKLGIICIALVLALGSLGMGYAAWTDTLYISGTVTTGSVEWEFDGIPTQGDAGLDPNCFFDLDGGTWEQMDKDVASTTVGYSDTDGDDVDDTLTVTLDNAYPYYANHIGYKVHGLGSIPLQIWKADIIVDGIVVATIYYVDEFHKLDLDGDGKDDLQIWWGSVFGPSMQLHACDSRDMSFELLVLQEAPQDETLYFTIELVAIQYDHYTPGELPDNGNGG